MRRAELPAQVTNAGIAILATLLTLGAIELYFRLTYSETPSAQRDFPPGRFPHLNADGLRDVDYGPKMPGAYRVLVLGNSFTFGSGVEDDAAIWPSIIWAFSRRLAASRRPRHRRVRR